jgi:hypothetical protein
MDHDLLSIVGYMGMKLLWLNAMETPLGYTEWGLEQQLLNCEAIYAKVESADMGAGYQLWQVRLMDKIRKRVAAIEEKKKSL